MNICFFCIFVTFLHTPSLHACLGHAPPVDVHLARTLAADKHDLLQPLRRKVVQLQLSRRGVESCDEGTISSIISAYNDTELAVLMLVHDTGVPTHDTWHDLLALSSSIII